MRKQVSKRVALARREAYRRELTDAERVQVVASGRGRPTTPNGWRVFYGLHSRAGVDGYETFLDIECYKRGWVFTSESVGKAPWSRHWTVETPDGVRVLDYWPTSQCWASSVNGQSGTALSPDALLETAASVLASRRKQGGV